jgi:hypothetical protein
MRCASQDRLFFEKRKAGRPLFGFRGFFDGDPILGLGLHGREECIVSDLNGVDVKNTLGRWHKLEVDDVSERPTVAERWKGENKDGNGAIIG